MNFALSILPLILIIATGYVLARTGTLPRADWKGIETLSFRILIPAVLILAITGTDLSWGRFGPFMAAVIIAFVCLLILCLLPRVLPTNLFPNPAFTTIFQTGLRWNAFVALAAAEQFLGDPALAVLAVAIALLIPSINVSCIVVLAAFGPEKVSGKAIVMTVLKNPLVQACAIGLALYATGVPLTGPVEGALEMTGRGALAVGLLAVGAGISLRRLASWDWKVGVALLLRPILAPLVFLICALWFELGTLQTLAGVLVFAAPAATNGYIIAKQMGGDADLYADVLTWQTLLSLAVLPIWAWALLAA